MPKLKTAIAAASDSMRAQRVLNSQTNNMQTRVGFAHLTVSDNCCRRGGRLAGI